MLRYDDGFMRVSDADRAALLPKREAAHAAVEARREDQGWFELPYDVTGAADLRRLADGYAKRFRRLLVVGIGGSDLGARTLCRALRKHGGKGMEVVFASAPDPDVLAPLVKAPKAWWKETVLYVVSKSGGTLETLSTFFLLRQAMVRAVGTKALPEQIVVTTDPKPENPLLMLAETEGYRIIPHPLDVGGRFSVLSPTGLFPAACAGVDIAALLEGAKEMENARRKEGVQHVSARFAANQFLAGFAGRKIHVLMPYAHALAELGFWYRQLWAESLGKNSQGPTPVAASGPTDQHSQIQLYTDGPDDKTVTFVEVEQFGAEFVVPPVKGPRAFSWLAGLDAAQILHAERQGTAEALYAAGKVNGTLFLDDVSPGSVGALLMFFMQATAYMGAFLGVDTYDQPGVEEGKKLAKRLLGGT